MDKELKKILVFGYGLSAIFLFIAFRSWHHRGVGFVCVLFAFLACLMLIITVSNRALLEKIHVKWMIGAKFIGHIVTTLILTTLFIFVFSPMGILFRIIKKDFLNTKLEPQKASYWRNIDKNEFDRDRCTKQY